MADRRRFITFEGGEGAGKSTQIQRLAQRLAANGYDVVLTHEPGGSLHAEGLRRVLLSGAVAERGPVAEAFLFAAARAEHVAAVVEPAIQRGIFILCDRFIDSTRVYQGIAGVPHDVLAALEDLAVGPYGPDLTILFDLPAEVGRERISLRAGKGGPDRFESEPPEVHDARRRAFLEIAAAEPQRFAVVDATHGEAAIALEVAAIVAARFGVSISAGT